MQIKEIGPVAPCNFKRIAESFCRDKADLGTLALCQCIDHCGRAVGNEIDIGRINSTLFKNIKNAGFEIRRRRVCLGSNDASLSRLRVSLEADQIGKSAANVGGNPAGDVTHCFLLDLECSRPAGMPARQRFSGFRPQLPARA